ncbi:MAG: NYN domain-containing protein [Treponema sp.]|uniref:NYN domain-containing protein n=1 Tax=Treponema sp. TaxID=166 RepID=UPI003FA1A9B7
MDRKYLLLIDGDNISPSFLEAIITEVSKEGELLIKRLYGDWTTPNMNGWKAWLEKIPIRPVQQFRNGPNATDNTIIMDAIELANTNKSINAVCIVSTDSDYYSLALKLREYGLYVLGIGKQNAKDIWVNACNEFKYLENLDSTMEETKPQDSPFDSLEKLISHAYKNSRTTEEGWVSLSDLGKSIRRTMPGFDPRSYNHNTLREILEALSDEYEMTADKLVPPNHWIKMLERQNTGTLTGRIKRFKENWGIIETADHGDFYFVLTNLTKSSRRKKITEGMSVRFKVFKEPNPRGENSAEKNGKAMDVEVR